MSPFSGPVLGSAAVVASPAFYRAFVLDMLPWHVAVIRYLVAAVICWVALSIVAALVEVGRPDPAHPDEAPGTSGTAGSAETAGKEAAETQSKAAL